ncbi:actin related protein centractin-like protein [Thalassiosira pseudonana CCMP1335]|uniref:Actin related protein centractin-like protein n=1 Tax=Thalassiosira pseudonana TaxID=35128 RepID=B8CAA7_THAPS|nr:actin related protein centractin-like protein [Thalassiosira pseudonana CCMP1335]EED89473.1 actin related protein centractin-like protein [Thalassiosira pseudonana CCMP1335]
MASNEEGNSFGGDAWESHELFNLYLQHAFQNALGLAPPTGTVNTSALDRSHHHPLLMLDKPHTPPPLRQRMLEILFETHNLPATFFLRDAVAACYAVGRTTATVVDVGYSSTMVTPVYEGFVESRGVLRNNACGARAVEERVLEVMDGLVVKQGGRKRKDRVEGEATAMDIANPVNNMFLTSAKLPYTLPDGTLVEITTASRCDIAELYFGNDEYNTTQREKVLDESNDQYFHYFTSSSPAQMVCDAAFRCDRDQQASLLGNVVVCGGGAYENAFPDRLREEIEAIVHRHTMGWRVKVTSPNINERGICSWLGGSILGSLGTFQDMWISKRDYEEFGSAIVNRKCP